MDNKTGKIRDKISVLFWCFVVFSMLGMITEMIFCYITTGVIESRQGLVWGPFCPIYGVGAVIAIILLDGVKDNIIKLFFFGAVVGGIVEYVLSYILESMYGTRFWDYSYTTYNLNGRICFLYSVFWGILAIIIIRNIAPIFNKIIKGIHQRFNKRIFETIMFIFLIVDSVCTVWAVSAYKTRVKNTYYDKPNEEIWFYEIGQKLFPNEYMLKAFPNIRFINDDGEEIYIRNVIKEQ